MHRLVGLALLILCGLVPAALAGVVPTPPLALQDEGTPLPISFLVDCQGTGIVCDFNPVTGRLQVKVEAAASGTASTANALAADPADCLVAGTVPTGINASGTATGCFDVATQAELDAAVATLQPLDAELTALANLVCLNGIAEYVAGTLTCGTDDGGVASYNGRTGAVTPQAGDYTAALIGSTPTGSVGGSTVQDAIAELASEKQPSDTDLTTLAGKNVVGVGGDVRLSTGTFAVNDCVQVNANGDFSSAGAACGTGDGEGGAVSSVFGRTGAVSAIVGDYTGAHISTTPGGNLSTSTAQANITELDTEKAALADLATNDGTVNQAGDLVSWNKLRDVPPEFADGTDASSVGGGAQGLQANADVQRQITNAVDLTSAVCIGGTDHKACDYGNATEGVVRTIFPAQDMTWKPAAGFDLNVKASDGTNIATFDEATKTLIVPNQILSPGIVKLFSSTSAPTINDDAGDGFDVLSGWVNTTPEPDEIWSCTDATPGAAKWQQTTSFTQVDKSLQDAANIGKTITTLNNEANALVLGDGTGGKKMWYDSALGWQEKVFPPGDIIVNAPSGFDSVIQVAGVEQVRWSAGGQMIFNIPQPISIPWSAGGAETDGTNCATQAQSRVNLGVRVQDFSCVAFATASGEFWLTIEPRTAWAPNEAMTFMLRIRTVGTTAQVWKADVAMWCVGEDEAYPSDTNMNAATPQELTINTLSTDGVRRTGTTLAVTPANSCTDTNSLVVRVKTKSGHTAASAKVIGGLIGAKYDTLGDFVD